MNAQRLPTAIHPATNHDAGKLFNFIFDSVLGAIKTKTTLGNVFDGSSYTHQQTKRLLVTNERNLYTFPNSPSLIYIYRNITNTTIVYADIDRPVNPNSSVPIFVGGSRLFARRDVEYLSFVSAGDNADNDPTYIWVEWYW